MIKGAQLFNEKSLSNKRTDRITFCTRSRTGCRCHGNRVCRTIISGFLKQWYKYRRTPLSLTRRDRIFRYSVFHLHSLLSISCCGQRGVYAPLRGTHSTWLRVHSALEVGLTEDWEIQLSDIVAVVPNSIKRAVQFRELKNREVPLSINEVNFTIISVCSAVGPSVEINLLTVVYRLKNIVN